MRHSCFRHAVALFLASLALESAASGILRVELSGLDEGACKTVFWEVPVVICRRSSEQVSQVLDANTLPPVAPRDSGLIKSLENAQRLYGRSFANGLLAMHGTLRGNPLRSLRDDIFVAVQFSPYAGCAVRPIGGAERHPTILPALWVGGFYNPCGRESYDLAGRIIAGHQRGNSWNLFVPPHRYDDSGTIALGALPSEANVPDFDFSPDLYDSRLSPSDRLLRATEWEDEALVRELLASHPNAYDANWFGVTPLLVASGRGNARLARMFLDHGADPNAQNQGGATPISVALLAGHTEMVALLLQSGASAVRACSASVCEPPYLIELMKREPNLPNQQALAKLLLEHGASPREIYKGKSVIQWARELADNDTIELLESYAERM